MSDKTELKKRAKALFTPPFKFDSGYIFDASRNMVADQRGDDDLRVRGWGRIQYMPDAEALQDTAGELIAEALTEYWNRRATIQPTAAEPVAEICGVWELRFVGSGPIAPIVERHGLKIGDKLYAHPAVAPADAVRDARNEAVDLSNEIEMVSGALELCEPEEQAAFKMIVQQLKGGGNG